MKFNKIYTLGLSLLLGSTLSLSAQKEDKNIYNMERLKADNPWISSYNAAGLTFNRFSDFSLAEIGFQYDKGDFRNVIDPTSAFGTKILAESYRKIDKVYFYGKFAFDYIHRQNKSWSSVLDPYATPFFLADSVPGRQTLESYILDAGVGTTFGEHWAVGGYVHYQVASNSKKKDVRNTNTYMEFEIYPGVMYKSKYFNLGANFLYQRSTEKVTNKLFGEGINHEVFYFEGMWFYTSVTTTNNYSEDRNYTTNIYGGAAQVELATGKVRFLNQFTGKKADQTIWINHVQGQRGGQMERTTYSYNGHLDIDGDKFHHVIKGEAHFNETQGFENMQKSEIVDGYTTWTQYGKKNKNTQDATTYDVSYTLYRDRAMLDNSWNASAGVKGFNVKNTYRLYPVEYSQKWENTEVYAAFNKNFQFKKGMFDCGIGLAYTAGDGTMLKVKSVSDEITGEDLYKQRTDLLQREFDYITADKFTGQLKARYTYFLNKEKGMNLYADAHATWKRALSGSFKDDDRTAVKIMLGFSF
ncbi:DUF6850 family outer membrane beta-barrel protein [Butyricimonas hominis]|uniref:DUF6850 domain-containing protein n=1 Tax=Butyricimonas hominis TaxID=2763032 RepID=A0ABR7D8E6_9BACT|nr:DUF6850 family outer membrane beta-barrel protein [Butyricimonas hominis]MBC5623610.1 hypothetical protein [Butyricimonas hominis]